MCALGVLLLGIGSALKEKLPPKVAAMLILAGVMIAMIFLNLTLILQMMNMNA
jgi:hypothetical protein